MTDDTCKSFLTKISWLVTGTNSLICFYEYYSLALYNTGSSTSQNGARIAEEVMQDAFQDMGAVNSMTPKRIVLLDGPNCRNMAIDPAIQPV